MNSQRPTNERKRKFRKKLRSSKRDRNRNEQKGRRTIRIYKE